MLRLPLAKSHLKRSIRPLYGWSQATPKSGFLNPAWDRSVPIWPGMALMHTGGDTYTLLNGTGVPAGLCAHYIGGDGVDELLDQGINALGVWVLGPDAEFEVDAPAFDSTLTWTEPSDGTDLLVHASTTGANRGKLVPAGTVGASTNPVGRLIKVISASTIVVGGLLPRTP